MRDESIFVAAKHRSGNCSVHRDITWKHNGIYIRVSSEKWRSRRTLTFTDDCHANCPTVHISGKSD
jgi:hypothetical protein